MDATIDPDEWRDVLGDALIVRCRLPVGPARGAPPSPEVTANLFDVLALVEQGLLSAREPRADDAGDDALARLERKVDVLVQLVLAQRRPEELPTRCVWVSRQGLVIAGADPLPIADGEDAPPRAIALVPSAALPWPCTVPVTDARWHDGALGLRFASDSASLDAALGRWIFRLHRRQIASARSG